MKLNITNLFLVVSLCATIFTANLFAQERVKTANGVLEGTVDKAAGIRSFKGVPFGAPPVGEFRWQPPQPVKNWEGIRKADKFGPRAMQRMSSAI